MNTNANKLARQVIIKACIYSLTQPAAGTNQSLQRRWRNQAFLWDARWIGISSHWQSCWWLGLSQNQLYRYPGTTVIEYFDATYVNGHYGHDDESHPYSHLISGMYTRRQSTMKIERTRINDVVGPRHLAPPVSQ